MTLIAIDPGTTGNLGWAFFSTKPGSSAMTLSMPGLGLQKLTALINSVAAWSRQMGAGFPLTFVFEMPEFYRARMSKGDPNKLAKLVKQIGWIQGYASAHATCNFHEYLPKQWKGQVPKHITEQRARAILSPAERDMATGAKSDEWDAIALGLFHLKRLTPQEIQKGFQR